MPWDPRRGGEDIREIRMCLREIIGSKDVFGFEIAQLQNNEFGC
jgi:hypothetical protein